ncbi:hypothetical protein [uncultured Ferrimonas sp.]|uniref:hypothetical protein n=1 Tax=uncultured Ferrimonas sp. TaxID=432640 RepID=UPI00262ED9AB|nr:hypothetical protein [uncultured Ferrimonas sp.]
MALEEDDYQVTGRSVLPNQIHLGAHFSQFDPGPAELSSYGVELGYFLSEQAQAALYYNEFDFNRYGVRDQHCLPLNHVHGVDFRA